MGKYLANQIKQNKEKATISNIKDSAGKPANSPAEINKIFRSFYANFYSSDKDPSQEDINSFLNSTDLPQLNKGQTNILDTPITQYELLTALNLIPNNKTPGPDGLPAESTSGPF